MIVADNRIAHPRNQGPLARNPGQKRGNRDDRHQRAEGDGDGEDATETLQAAVAGQQQTAVADERGERIDRNRDGRTGRHAVTTFLFQKFVNDVNAVVDANAENDGHGDEIGRVQRRVHIAKQTEGDGDAHELRDSR